MVDLFLWFLLDYMVFYLRVFIWSPVIGLWDDDFITSTCLVRPDPRVTELGRGFQIGAIRPIRVDHTDFFKWLLKLIHS